MSVQRTHQPRADTYAIPQTLASSKTIDHAMKKARHRGQPTNVCVQSPKRSKHRVPSYVIARVSRALKAPEKHTFLGVLETCTML